jgi:hypothetical protein
MTSRITRLPVIPSARVFTCIMCLALVLACSPGERKNEAPTQAPVASVPLPDAPNHIADSIRAEFPGALPVHIYADSILSYVLTRYKITPDQMLLGASTCVDDIIYTKNFQTHREIKGPFNLGGLGGLPFSGISGLSAFAHHIPEHGTMVLMIAPHIGYTKDKGWGYVLRSGQHDPSTCCGALMGTMQKLERGLLKQTVPTAVDYQGIIINNLVLQHEKEITGHHNPIATLTKIIYEEAEKQILDQVKSMELEHINYIVTVSGVLINTDSAYTDYLWLKHFSVYDVKNKIFLEEKKN